jgi:UPF0755 protein
MLLIKIIWRISLLITLLSIAWLIYFANLPIRSTPNEGTFDVEAGSRFRSVAQQLLKQGVISDPYSFEMMARLLGRATDVKAGIYVRDTKITYLGLLDQLTSGISTQSSITFIEGWTFGEMRSALNANSEVKHVTMGETDEEILRGIGAKEKYPEGLFFPDTYFFTPGTTDRDILKRAYQTMQYKLDNAWKARAQSLPYDTPYKALIMASIVEKETGRSFERKKIAGVFVNRMRIGMRLQTDPTVIYGKGELFDGNLRKNDLLHDTPYNTYTRSGLPPTPIAMPGLASIEAAMHPEITDALYFVGKGDGTHRFSSTLQQHNNAVIKYQIGGKHAR